MSTSHASAANLLNGFADMAANKDFLKWLSVLSVLSLSVLSLPTLTTMQHREYLQIVASYDFPSSTVARSGIDLIQQEDLSVKGVLILIAILTLAGCSKTPTEELQGGALYPWGA